MDLSHIGDSVSKWRPESLTFKEIFIIKSEELITKVIPKFPQDEVLTIARDLAFILRSLSRYDILNKEVMDSFTTATEPLLEGSTSKLKPRTTFLMFEAYSKY